jgi:hypothetical protein
MTDLNLCEKKIYSQNGEDGITMKLVELLYDPSENNSTKYYVEFGVENGDECNTRILREKYNWNGLMMDGRFENKTINLQNEYITKENIIQLLKKYNVPSKINLLSVDIDFNDFYCLHEILKNYECDIIICEYNGAHFINEDKIIIYDAYAQWDCTNYFGASFLSLYKLGEKFGYSLIHCDYIGINCFFIRTELLKSKNIKLLHTDNIEQIYKSANYVKYHVPGHGTGPNGGHPQDPQYRKYISSDDAMNIDRPKYFVVPYSCIGDQLSLSGAVHYLLQEKNAYKVCILASSINYDSVKHLYEDYPQVTVYPVEYDYHFSEERHKFENLPIDKRDGYELVAFGNHSGKKWRMPRVFELDALYLAANIPKEVRFSHFRLPKRLDNSLKIYNKLVEKVGKDYVIIHDDPSRLLILNYDKVRTWLSTNGLSHLPVVYLGYNRNNYPLIKGLNNVDVTDIILSHDIFDNVDLLRNAKVCHMMDSSLGILLDYITDSCRSDQYRISHERLLYKLSKDLYKSKWEFEEGVSMLNEFDPKDEPV